MVINSDLNRAILALDEVNAARNDLDVLVNIPDTSDVDLIAAHTRLQDAKLMARGIVNK